MGLKIFWTDFAKSELKSIYEYHKNIASDQVAKKLVKGIATKTKNLTNQPEMGQLEEFLKARTQKFRHLIHTNYKIIYWINVEKFQIEIFDVFDCRQNPKKISRN